MKHTAFDPTIAGAIKEILRMKLNSETPALQTDKRGGQTQIDTNKR